jgi:histidine ammonia-lyase
VKISDEDLTTLQENLVKSHSCNIGDIVNPEIVKLMLLLKIHAVSLGKSAVQLSTVERMIEFFNNDILPVVHQQGSLGASGDLAPLAKLFLPLIGLGNVHHKGEIKTGEAILKEFGWEPVILGAKEGLALLNGTQFMSSHAVYTCIKAQKIAKLSDMIAAVSVDAYDARTDAYIPQLHTIRPHNGQIETAKNMLSILKDSPIAEKEKEQVQDPYSFRCIPQVHGASKDTINYVSSVVTTEINSVTDNPTVFPEDDLIVSGGNFHGEPLAQVLDFLAIGLSELGSISERRVYRLISGQRNLPEFLVAEPGLNSGFMIPQYSAAAIVSQNKQLCTPASVDSIPSSNEQEDHVSMGGNAATKAKTVADNVMKVLAIELYNAAQALEFRRPSKTSPFLENFIAKYREEVAFVKDDVVMYDDIQKSIDFLETYSPELP